MNEFERIEKLLQLFGAPPKGVSLSIGDDAAVIPLSSNDQLVWTVDACVENTHFRCDIASWEDVGFRSFTAAASDLAAMSAVPIGALSALTLPTSLSDQALHELARGQLLAARSINTGVIGGNLSRGYELTVTTTLIGRTNHPIRRDTACPGDVMAVCGDLGLAAAGLRLLLECPDRDAKGKAELAALTAWRRPVARIEDGLACRDKASSLIDVSDGLAQDAAHVAKASRIRVDLDPENVVSELLREACALVSVDPVSLVLSGGEDYALLGTFPANCVPSSFVPVGRCSSGEGVWVNGVRVDGRGHDHFRESRMNNET